MSVIPMDERLEGQAASGETTASRSVWGRLRAGLTSLIRRLPYSEALLDHHSGTNETKTSGQRSHLIVRDQRGTVPAMASAESASDRHQPLSSSAQTLPDRDRVELTGEPTDGVLTITHPDNPDATITSDTWVDVER